MLTSELRQHIREIRSEVQKAKYFRERKLNLDLRPKLTLSSVTEKRCALDECARKFIGKSNKIYCGIRCSSRASYLKSKERAKKEVKKKKCEDDDCPNEFIGRDNRQKYCSGVCADRDYYRTKGKALRKLREREDQLERLAGY